MLRKLFGNDLRELLRHSKNYISVEIIVAGLAFFTLPIITRLLTPGEYGIISIFISLTSIFNLIFLLSINGAVSINYIKNKFPYREYLFSAMVFLFFSNVVLFSIIFLLSGLFSAALNIPAYIIIATAVTSISNVYFNLKLSLYQIKKESKRYSFLYGIKNVAIIVISIIAICLLKSQRYNGWVYSTMIISIVFSLISILSLLRESKPVFRIAFVKDALIFGLPLLPHALSGFLLRFFDQIIINQLLGSAKTGLYSFAYQVGFLMNLIVMSMDRSWQPIYWEFIRKNAWTRMNKLAGKYAKIVYLFAIGLIFFSKEIVMLIADHEYFSSLNIIPIIIFSYVFVFLYNLFSGITFYRKRTWLISINTMIAAAVNILLNYMLIPSYGYKIAAWTTLVSYGLLFVLHYLTSRYYLKYDKLKLQSVLPDFVFLMIIFVLYFLVNSLPFSYVFVLIIKALIFVSASVYLFWKNIKQHLLKE